MQGGRSIAARRFFRAPPNGGIPQRRCGAVVGLVPAGKVRADGGAAALRHLASLRNVHGGGEVTRSSSSATTAGAPPARPAAQRNSQQPKRKRQQQPRRCRAPRTHRRRACVACLYRRRRPRRSLSCSAWCSSGRLRSFKKSRGGRRGAQSHKCAPRSPLPACPCCWLLLLAAAALLALAHWRSLHAGW